MNARGAPAAGVAGAVVIAFSAILMEKAHVAPATAAAFRCAYAVPFLAVLAAIEGRRLGPRVRRARLIAVPTGIVFAVNLTLWGHAIDDVGAGLSTVLGNVQVVLVPLLAWLLLKERVAPRLALALPLVLAGVVLISGALEAGAYGADPARGTLFGIACGAAYAVFILLQRQAGSGGRHVAGPLLDTTVVAALAAAALGAALGDVDLVPSWPAHAWLGLLALSSQVLGWMLISFALPRLPAALTSVTLTIQPVGSVALGALLLGEEPSPLQLAGVALIVAGLVAASTARAARRATRPASA